LKGHVGREAEMDATRAKRMKRREVRVLQCLAELEEATARQVAERRFDKGVMGLRG
jgi:hypothetical protein